jgi:multicomponent Na+:H+ antiporter subunit F
MDFAMDVIFWILIGFLLLCFIRLLKGPSIWDRLLGMNIVATKIVVIIIVYAAINETAFLLDFAIIYALSGFIGTIYISLFFADRKRRRKRK